MMRDNLSTAIYSSDPNAVYQWHESHSWSLEDKLLMMQLCKVCESTISLNDRRCRVTENISSQKSLHIHKKTALVNKLISWQTAKYADAEDRQEIQLSHHSVNSYSNLNNMQNLKLTKHSRNLNTWICKDTDQSTRTWRRNMITDNVTYKWHSYKSNATGQYPEISNMIWRCQIRIQLIY